MSDADAREVIARDLYDYHPTVTGMMSGIVRDLSWHELVALGDFPEIITQNRLQADAILEALADAGYAVVRKSQIELFIDSLEFELEGMMSSRVDDVVGWMKAVFTGGDVEQWIPDTPKWRVADDVAT